MARSTRVCAAAGTGAAAAVEDAQQPCARAVVRSPSSPCTPCAAPRTRQRLPLLHSWPPPQRLVGEEHAPAAHAAHQPHAGCGMCSARCAAEQAGNDTIQCQAPPRPGSSGSCARHVRSPRGPQHMQLLWPKCLVKHERHARRRVDAQPRNRLLLVLWRGGGGGGSRTQRAGTPSPPPQHTLSLTHQCQHTPGSGGSNSTTPALSTPSGRVHNTAFARSGAARPATCTSTPPPCPPGGRRTRVTAAPSCTSRSGASGRS